MTTRYTTLLGPAADALHAALALVAPGRPLRDGLDRVVRAKMGALVVVGDGPDVLAICSGGFLLDSPYSPQRMSELAKMDGAIILSNDCTRIARANVHLVPDPTVPTSETGTRHRTAERVARSLKVPVISASEEMGVISVYAGGAKHQLQDISRLLDRANQALQTLERYRARLNDTLSALTANELEDVATVRDVAAVVQRGDMVHRIATELETMIVELGVDARLLRLQLDEVYGEIDNEMELVAADYPTITGNYAGSGLDGDASASPRGLRLLARVPRVTPALALAVVERFGELSKLQRASVDEIAQVPGIDPEQAEDIKATLDRLTESSILDQYH
jgi:diadenylate cyclase